MSNLALAAKRHGTKFKMPSLKHLEAKLSSLMAVAQGQQGPGPQRMFFIGLALLAVIVFVAWRKHRA